MSRFLSIHLHDPDAPMIRSPEGVDVPGYTGGERATVYGIERAFVAEFRRPEHAIDFTSAVALQPNNRDVRAPLFRRLDCHVCPTAIAGRWYVVSDESDDRLAVGIFAAREDADLFVRYMARS